MFTIAILIGLYGYSIFFLGIFQLLYRQYVILDTILFCISSVFIFISIFCHSGKIRRNLTQNLTNFKSDPGFVLNESHPEGQARMTLNKLIFVLLIVFCVVNLIGVLGPELAFDALWYHLTLPKLYLQSHSIRYIPGGLYYYSVMPQLTEMLYTAALSIGNEITAKVIHFLFGILTSIALYKLSRKFLTNTFSLLGVLVFYSNLVVAWESITAYRDLATTFYQVMVIWALLNFIERKQNKWLVLCGCMIGFSISTNLLSVTSIPIYLLVLLSHRFYSSNKRSASRSIVLDFARTITIFSFFAFLIPFPWFIYSYIHTGNPIYPFFTGLYPVPLNIHLYPILVIKEIIKLLLFAPDPLNPIYLITLPLILQSFKRFNSTLKTLTIYCLAALMMWYILPRTGGGRYILPYLPIFSLITVTSIKQLKEHKLRLYLITLIIMIAVINLSYRALANAKYLPVIIGRESKKDFLCRNLNFEFGDFYDCDGKLGKIIKPHKKVLIYGGHNFYYAEFNFVHASYAEQDHKYDYILTQNTSLPQIYKKTRLIYENKHTKVKLYRII